MPIETRTQKDKFSSVTTRAPGILSTEGLRSSTFLIIASGPSLSPEQIAQAKSRKSDINVIAINDNYKLAPWADILYACDPQWWDWHNGALEFTGRRITQEEGRGKGVAIAEKYDLELIRSVAMPGLSTDPGVIHQGQNSGYQAINLAYHLGAKKIILIGYDMQRTNGKSHWFGDHPNKVDSGYVGWLQVYKTLADDANKLNLEVINCTLQTALTCFRKASLESALSSVPDQA